METMTIEQIEDYIFEQLPRVLEKNPRFVLLVEGIVAEKFPRRDEFARLLDEVRDLRTNTDTRFEKVENKIDNLQTDMDKRFEQVDKRFEQVDERMDGMEKEMKNGFKEMREGFHNMQVHIDRLGSRWGIRNESIFRQTMKEVLEKSAGMTVKESFIAGEQFDCVISNGKHILIEITASAGKNILERLKRKRQLYIDNTGISPDRFILVVGSIHSRRAESLRAEGFEIIEPEE